MSVQNTEAIVTLLRQWLNSRLETGPAEWLEDRCCSIRAGDLQALYLGFGLVSRKIPKLELELNHEELAQAEAIRPGWQPGFWSLQEAARTLLILEYAPENADQFMSVLDKLFAAGEIHELVALYQAIPVLPYPQRLAKRAGEGVRTNMQSIFRAIAHRNPFPSEQLDEGMWNQMILKCLFIGVPLHPVVGLDSRVNSALSQMLCDYAHERWAASRTVHPELWRCVRPEMTATALNDLQRVMETGNELEKKAAALSLASSSLTEAKEMLLAMSPEFLKQIDAETLSWQSVNDALEAM